MRAAFQLENKIHVGDLPDPVPEKGHWSARIAAGCASRR